jgi:acetyl esterase
MILVPMGLNSSISSNFICRNLRNDRYPHFVTAVDISMRISSLQFSSEFVIGVFAGFGLSFISNIIAKWDRKFSFIINFVNVFPEFFGRSRLCDIGDHDLDKINKIRIKHAVSPLGAPASIAKTWKVDVKSTNGHIIPVHFYEPLNYKPNSPVIVWLHGGGFVIGNTKMYEPITTKLAAGTGCLVASIEYRKAPECKFPGPVNDCIEATKWIYDHVGEYGGDQNRLVVIGDSAGGNLTIIVTCELNDFVKLSIPIYPAISFGVLSESKVKNHDAPFLKALSVDWYNLRYFRQRSDLLDPLATPLQRNDLHLLPRTHVITAECDVLVGEGEEYVSLLKRNGVEVTHTNYLNTIHGFFGVELLTHGNEALVDTCHLIKSHFGL